MDNCVYFSAALVTEADSRYEACVSFPSIVVQAVGCLNPYLKFSLNSSVLNHLILRPTKTVLWLFQLGVIKNCDLMYFLNMAILEKHLVKVNLFVPKK